MYWWRENIGALPIPSRDQGVLKLVGDVCEMAICLAWMCADRAGINSFCRELFAVQAAIPSFASALKKSPTDQLVAQVELSQDQIRMALEWEPCFQNPASSQVERLLGNLGHSVPAHADALTGQVVRVSAPPADLPDWVDWGTPSADTWYGAVGHNAEDVKRAQECGFRVVDVRPWFAGGGKDGGIRGPWGGTENFFPLLLVRIACQNARRKAAEERLVERALARMRAASRPKRRSQGTIPTRSVFGTRSLKSGRSIVEAAYCIREGS